MNVPAQLIQFELTDLQPTFADYIQSQKDENTRKFNIQFLFERNILSLSGCTATATVTIDNVLIDQELACTVDDTNNYVTVVVDAPYSGVMAVQVTLASGNDILTMPRPLYIRVTQDIAETAQIDDNSHGSFAEIVTEVANARGEYATLAQAINAKMDADDATVYHVDTTTQNLTYDNTNPKTIYLNARVSYGSVSNRAAIVISTSSKAYQFAVTVTGDILMRSGGGTYPTDWTVLYGSSYKKNVINDDNKNSSVFIPTIGAVVNYLVANYIGNGSGTVKTANIDNGAVTLPKLDTGVIDSTLAVQGAAADAKVTGDNIRDFNGAINPVLTTVNGKRIVSTTGEIATQEEYSYIEINVVPGLIISGYTRVSPSIYYGAAFYGSSNEYISGAYNDSSVGDWNYSLTAPENAVKLRISCRTNYLSQFTAKFAEFSTSAIVAINNNADDIKHLSAIENEIYFKADAEVAYNTDVEMTLENGVINKKGTTTYTGDANYRHARIDDLRPNDSYQITGICVNNSNYTYPLLSIIDSANNVISTPYTGANGQITNFAFTIPENADHMFVNFKIDNPYGLKKGSPMTVPQSIEKFRLEESGLSNFYEEQNRRALYNLSFNAPFVWQPFDKAYISWMNDDARTDMYLYKDLCDEYNIPYANAVPWEKIAQNPNIDGTPLVTYLKGIISDGGEVFSHALTWLTSSSTKADFYTQFITSKRAIEAAIESDVYGIIQAGGSGYSGADYNKCQEYSISYYQFSDAYGVTPQYTLGRTRYLRSDYNSDAEQLAAYKAAIDDAVTNHKWLRLWCHGTDEVSIDVLTQVFQYAQTYIDRGLLSFTTWQNMYDTFRSHA